MVITTTAESISIQSFLHRFQYVENLIESLKDKLRKLYYRTILFAKPCPQCQIPDLTMLRDSWCKCQSCDHEFDPTVEFQECLTCGGPLSHQIFHYWCEKCRQRAVSTYCFDARVFDAMYFREKMQESRQRKSEKRKQMKQMLANTRSGHLVLPEDPSLSGMPGLEAELNQFVKVPLAQEMPCCPEAPLFDMKLYRQHIKERVSGCTVRFEGISSVIDEKRLDRIYRFITVIFMQHNGEIILRQDQDGEILIWEDETHRER